MVWGKLDDVSLSDLQPSVGVGGRPSVQVRQDWICMRLRNEKNFQLEDSVRSLRIFRKLLNPRLWLYGSLTCALLICGGCTGFAQIKVENLIRRVVEYLVERNIQ